MGVLFLILIFVLTVLGGIGMWIEIYFWWSQHSYLSRLDSTMQGMPDPQDLDATFLALGLDGDHPLHPALDRILATESSPEGALDLVEMRRPSERFFSAARKYATAVLLLCGIAGTLFSLKDALPTSGLATAFDASGQIDSAKYGEAFRKLQPALANAFFPSICGILATLALQFARYGWLVPAQDAVGRLFVTVACSWLIPWKRRHEEGAMAASSAAAKFAAAAEEIFAATSAGAEAVRQSADAAASSFSGLGATLDSMGGRLSLAFDAAAAQILGASNNAIAGVEGCARQASDSLKALGQGLVPVTDRMNLAVLCLDKSGETLRSSALQFEKSLAANGPFHQAIEQLYAAVSPAEARYERLLLSIGELQKLSTTQNVEIARLVSETATLAKAALQSADEAKGMTKGVTVVASGFPGVSQSVKDHGAALTKIAGEWQQAAALLASEFSLFRDAMGKIEASQAQTLAALLQNLPGSIAEAIAAQLPQQLQPLVDTVAHSQQNADRLYESLGTLEYAVDGLRNDLQALSFTNSGDGGSPPGAIRARRKKSLFRPSTWWR